MKKLLYYHFFILIVVGCHMEVPVEPSANFTFTPSTGCQAPCEITFTNTSVNSSSVEWDFDDGSIKEKGDVVKHNFVAGRDYFVKLVAKSESGGSQGMTATVKITPEPDSNPVADFIFTADNESLAPSKVSFTNRSVNSVRYSWNFGDPNASTGNLNTSTEQNPIHTYNNVGKYLVTMTAYNAKNISSVDTSTVIIKSNVPVADFSFTGDNCTAPCEVTFTNTSQFADSFEWSFGDVLTSKSKDPGKVKFEKAGTYRVTLKASGPGGTAVPKTKDVIINASASAFEIIWEKTYGGAEYEQVQAMAATSDGGAILVGREQVESGTNNEFKAIKINSDGIPAWEKSYGGSANDAATAVILLSDGFLIGGYSNSDANKSKAAPKYAGYDYWVIKTDLSGNKLWDKSYGGDGDDILKAMVPTSDGGFLLGGSSNSGINGNKSASSLGDNDFWLVKINAAGAKEWDKSYGGTNDDRINAMTINNKVIMLAGYSKSSANGRGKTATAYGGQDYWVVKVNENGDRVSGGEYSFGGSGDDQIYAAFLTDRYAVGGVSSSNGGTGNKDNILSPNYGSGDFYVYKFDDAGARTWERTYGGSKNDKLNSLASTPDGGYLIIGETESGVSGNKTTGNYGKADSWLIKVNADGKMEKEATLGGSGNDKMNVIIRLSDSSYLIAGESNSPVSENKSAPNLGEEDFWVIKVKLK